MSEPQRLRLRADEPHRNICGKCGGTGSYIAIEPDGVYERLCICAARNLTGAKDWLGKFHDEDAAWYVVKMAST